MRVSVSGELSVLLSLLLFLFTRYFPGAYSIKQLSVFYNSISIPARKDDTKTMAICCC